MHKRKHLLYLGPLFVAAALLFALLYTFPNGQAQKASGRSAVASESPPASRAAIKILKAGGNAVDAAITAALMAGVTSGTSSGIGGGGFALVWQKKEQRAMVLDFRETAPRDIDESAFERRPLPWAERGQLTGVPGEVRGLFELHRRYGKLAWSDLVTPAAEAAQGGFLVGKHLANMLRRAKTKLMPIPGFGLYYPGQKPAAKGSVLRNPKLAATLRRIAAEGPKAFYEGSIARDIIDTVRAHGSKMSQRDLMDYRPRSRMPLTVRWQGHTVYTMPPPSAGGVMLVELLKLFKTNELRRLGYQTGAYQHMLAEGMRGAIADRMRYLGDPDHQLFDSSRLLSDTRLAKRRASISSDSTKPITEFGLESHGTHHLTTRDSDGNMVALTTTVNRLFGAKLITKKSGIVLNDELDDFSALAQVTPFGMKQSPNRARPLARPVSSMTPTIVVKGGEAILGLGGSGGTAIATNVSQLVLAHLVFGRTPKQAVSDRRFYVPTEGESLLLEPGEKRGLLDDLEARGEKVGTMKFLGTAVQMIAVDNKGVGAAADPRKHGLAMVD